MAHEGVSGYGTFERELSKFQKRAATTAESTTRAWTQAREKSQAPRKEDTPWWQTVIDYSPFGKKNVVTNKAVDSSIAAGKAVGGAISGLFDASKWVIVGLVALAAIVVVPRLLPGK